MITLALTALKHRVNNQRGVSLVMVLALGSVFSIMALFIFDYLNNMKAASKNLELQLKAKMLSEDALELTKYLLFYERILSINYPKHLPPSIMNMDDGLGGVGNWVKACSSLDYTVGGSLPVPEFKIMRADGVTADEVMCTTDLKDFRLSGNIWNMYLEKLSTLTDTPYTKISPGKYKLKTIFFNPLDSTNPDEFIKFNIEKKFVGFIKSIEVDIYFYTNESGFDSVDSERFIKMVSTVKYGKKALLGIGESIALSEETLMFRASNMKNFALFMAYPDTNPANILSDSFRGRIALDKVSNVYGKTYFKRGFDFSTIDLTNPASIDLPTFHDTVVLSGSIKNAPQPSLANIEALKQKFRRGFLVNVGEEYIFDTATINNLTGGLKHDLTINQYIKNAGAVAYCIAIPALDTVKLVINGLDVSNCSDSNVGTWGGPFTPVKGKNIGEILVESEKAFIMAPAEKLHFTKSPGTMYGVFLGGKISGKADIYSLEMMREGLPGIDATNQALKNMNLQANRTNDLIGVPLRNLPVVLRGK